MSECATEAELVAALAAATALSEREAAEGLRELVDTGWLTPNPSPIGLMRYVLTIPKGAKRGR